MRDRFKHLATAASAASLAAFAGGAGLAQSDVDAEAVARCRGLPTAAERFGCLEEYVLNRDEAAPAAPVAPVAPVAPAAPAVSAPTPAEEETPSAVAAAAPAAPAAATPVEETGRRGFLRLPSLPFVGGRGGEDDSDAAPAAPVVAGGEAAGADALGADALGAEQVADRSGEGRTTRREAEARYEFTIVDVGESYFGGLEVELDNGQVWRQQRDDGQRIMLRDDDPMTVQVWQSDRYGGYRMRLVEQRRTIRVQRIR